MISKNDFLVGILVSVAGILIWEFTPASAAPGGGLFMAGSMHATSHYIGAAAAIIFGLVGLALYKKVNMVTVAVSVLSILIGIVFFLMPPAWHCTQCLHHTQWPWLESVASPCWLD